MINNISPIIVIFVVLALAPLMGLTISTLLVALVMLFPLITSIWWFVHFMKINKSQPNTSINF